MACALLSALVIAVTVHPAADLGRYVLGWKPIRWVGERSYGIYLWHWPVFMVTRPTLDISMTGTPNLILRLAVTVALAELSFRYVEQPIRQGALGRWFKQLRASSGSARMAMWARTAVVSGSLLLGIVLLAVGLASGKPAPPPPGFEAASLRTATTTTTAPATTASSQPAGATGTPPPTATPNPAIPRITLVGDSVMVGAANALVQALGPVNIDAAVNRQFGQAIDILRAYKQQGKLSDTVVVHMGTNGVITQGHMDAIYEILGDRKRVVFVNLKVPRRWEQGDNDVIAANVARHPNSVLIDWHTIGNQHPEYFYEDGIHLRPDGARAYAELIRQQTAANP
jgi:hypothetical protein